MSEIEEGPTEILLGTSRLEQHYEPMRFRQGEIDGLLGQHKKQTIFSEIGDVYFANTFAIHRGCQPTQGRPRGMLSLLVSIFPSHRTALLPRRKLDDLPLQVQKQVQKNRRFFRHLVDG